MTPGIPSRREALMLLGAGGSLAVIQGLNYPSQASADSLFLQWPFPESWLNSWESGGRFGDRSHTPYPSPHRGVDFGPAGIDGTPIRAAGDGTVTMAGPQPNALGYYVRLDHSEMRRGVWTGYAHMRAGSIAVHSGQQVVRGTLLGLVGGTAGPNASFAPHLHWELFSNEIHTDPVAFMHQHGFNSVVGEPAPPPQTSTVGDENLRVVRNQATGHVYLAGAQFLRHIVGPAATLLPRIYNVGMPANMTNSAGQLDLSADDFSRLMGNLAIPSSVASAIVSGGTWSAVSQATTSASTASSQAAAAAAQARKTRFFRHGGSNVTLWIYVHQNGDFVRITDNATALLYREINGDVESVTLSPAAIQLLVADLTKAGGRDLSTL